MKKIIAILLCTLLLTSLLFTVTISASAESESSVSVAVSDVSQQPDEQKDDGVKTLAWIACTAAVLAIVAVATVEIKKRKK